MSKSEPHRKLSRTSESLGSCLTGPYAGRNRHIHSPPTESGSPRRFLPDQIAQIFNHVLGKVPAGTGVEIEHLVHARLAQAFPVVRLIGDRGQFEIELLLAQQARHRQVGTVVRE